MPLCDACGSSLEGAQAYEPRESARGAQVMQCKACGLIQTLYRPGVPRTRHAPSISSDAGWGNIRHGKALRVDAHWQTLSRYLSQLPDKSVVLDVGTNRGDFLRQATHDFPNLRFVGVEPDESLTPDWGAIQGASIHVGRLEDLELPTGSFDAAFCFHTLEHVDSAREMLQRLHRLSKRDGLLFLEVPNVSVVEDEDVIEEFFIDKHSFHFSREALLNLLSSTGWSVIEDFSDGRNLGVVCAGTTDPIPAGLHVPEVDLLDYDRRIGRNRALLPTVARQIEALEKRQEVCLWGAGRIFDGLWRFGGLQLERAVVIDTYLSKHLESINGFVIAHPDILATRNFDVAILLAKGSAGLLRDAAKRAGVRYVTTFDDLFRPLVDR